MKVSYTVPTTGADNKLRDVAGNDANGFTDQAVAKTELANAAPGFPVEMRRRRSSVDENSASGTAVGTVAATDPDGDALTYSLSAPLGYSHHEFFRASTATAVITVATGVSLDYETQSRFTIIVQVHDGKDIFWRRWTPAWMPLTTLCPSAVTDVEERITVSGVELIASTPTVDADGNNTNETYKPGDTVRARVTFSEAVDVTGSPVLKLRLAEDSESGSGEKDMTFNTGGSRTNTTNAGLHLDRGGRRPLDAGHRVRREQAERGAGGEHPRDADGDARGGGREPGLCRGGPRPEPQGGRGPAPVDRDSPPALGDLDGGD